jgi:hypothetical protein
MRPAAALLLAVALLVVAAAIAGRRGRARDPTPGQDS